MKPDAALAALAALAQDSRLSLYRLLVKRGPEGYPAGEIAQRLGIPAPTLSFHLKELQQAGLVIPRREGRFLHYSANFDRMRDLVGFLTENCCGQADQLCDSACKPINSSRRRTA